MRRPLRTLPSHRRANAAIEFAVIAPALLLLSGGIVELGLLLRVYAATNRLASQYAISYSECGDLTPGTCQTEAALYATSAAIGNIAPQLVPAQLTVTLIQAAMNGSTPTVTYSSPSGAVLTTAQTTALQAAVPSGQNGVVVTASYQHTLQYFPGLMQPLIGGALALSYTVAQLK